MLEKMGDRKHDSYTDLFKIGVLVSLTYAFMLVSQCPCARLLICKDHQTQFTAALLMAQGFVIMDTWRDTKFK